MNTYLNTMIVVLLLVLCQNTEVHTHTTIVKWKQGPLGELPRTKIIQDCTNNPGNITKGCKAYDTLAIGYVGKNKFLVFPDTIAGFKALELRIFKHKDETILRFASLYGGLWASELATSLGTHVNSRIENHLDQIENIKRTIAKHEGWKHKQKTY
jgi:hypothetical protein